MTQEQATQKFHQFYESLTGYGDAGQGTPIGMWFKKNGEYRNTFVWQVPNSFHVGIGNSRRILYDFPVAGDLIIAPFYFANTKINGVDNGEKLYIHPSGSAEIQSTTDLIPLEKRKIHYMWRFYPDVNNQNNWNLIEPRLYEWYMKQAGYIRTLGEFEEVTTGERNPSEPEISNDTLLNTTIQRINWLAVAVWAGIITITIAGVKILFFSK